MKHSGSLESFALFGFFTEAILLYYLYIPINITHFFYLCYAITFFVFYRSLFDYQTDYLKDIKKTMTRRDTAHIFLFALLGSFGLLPLNIQLGVPVERLILVQMGVIAFVEVLSDGVRIGWNRGLDSYKQFISHRKTTFVGGETHGKDKSAEALDSLCS
jgi:hypothetical protein